AIERARRRTRRAWLVPSCLIRVWTMQQRCLRTRKSTYMRGIRVSRWCIAEVHRNETPWDGMVRSDVSLTMTHDDSQVTVLVRAMIAKPGQGAPRAAGDRFHMWLKTGDKVTAGLWIAAAERAATVIAGNNLERKQWRSPRFSPGPPLSRFS